MKGYRGRLLAETHLARPENFLLGVWCKDHSVPSLRSWEDLPLKKPLDGLGELNKLFCKFLHFCMLINVASRGLDYKTCGEFRTPIWRIG